MGLTTLSDHPALLPLSDPPSESPHRLVAPQGIWRAGLFTTFSRLGFLHCSREVAMFARSKRGRVRGFERTRGRKALGKALRKARQSSRRGGESSVSRRRTSEAIPVPLAIGQLFQPLSVAHTWRQSLVTWLKEGNLSFNVSFCLCHEGRAASLEDDEIGSYRATQTYCFPQTAQNNDNGASEPNYFPHTTHL